MYNKKQNEKPLFAEVKPCDDEVRQQATNKDYKQQRDQRILHRESNGLTMYVRRLSEGRLQMPHWNDDYKTCSLDYKA